MDPSLRTKKMGMRKFACSTYRRQSDWFGGVQIFCGTTTRVTVGEGTKSKSQK